MGNLTTVIDPNIVDWTNLSSMIEDIPTIFPGIIALIVGLLPLIFIGMIVGLIVGLFDGIVEVVRGLTQFFKR